MPSNSHVKEQETLSFITKYSHIWQKGIKAYLQQVQNEKAKQIAGERSIHSKSETKKHFGPPYALM